MFKDAFGALFLFSVLLLVFVFIVILLDPDGYFLLVVSNNFSYQVDRCKEASCPCHYNACATVAVELGSAVSALGLTG